MDSIAQIIDLCNVRHLAMLQSGEISLDELIVRPTDEVVFNLNYFIGGMVIGLITLAPYFYMSNR